MPASVINATVNGLNATGGNTAGLELQVSGTTAAAVDSSGNVGIGTSSPAQRLEVASATGGTVGLRYIGNSGYATIGTDGNNQILFSIGNPPSERMRIDSSGNVGIGTSSPGNKLHVVSTGNTAAQITGKSTAAAFGSSTFWDGTGGGLQITNSETTTNAPTSIRFTQTGATDTAAGIAAVFSSISASNLVFCTNNGGVTVPERMRITSGGEVYIAGTTDQGAYNLQCNGTGVWGAGAYVNGSDARIKEDVAPIDSGLDVVEKLNPVTYRYKEDWSKDQSVQTGFIAQELLVALDGKNYVDGIVQQGGAEGYYSVAYQNIIPILTKAIQELNAKVEAQAAEIAALKGK